MIDALGPDEADCRNAACEATEPGKSQALITLYLTARRPAPPVQEQPRVCVREWRICQCADTQLLHLCGVLVGVTEALRLRVTSALAAIDPQLRLVQTSSGRVYELLGPPAADPEILPLIAQHMDMQGVIGPDVSEALWRAMQPVRC